jgi:SagB-type dehydrogenase family enzyme
VSALEPADAARIPSIRLAARIYGAERVPLDDPAEHFHEASKIYPTFGARQTRGHELERDGELQLSSLRAVKRSRHLQSVPLPEPDPLDLPFGAVLARRRSVRRFAQRPIPVTQLAALLHAGYGRTGQLLADAHDGIGPQLRTVPSGGALYPLELYAFAWRVAGLRSGLYHFDPLRRVLERVRAGDERRAVLDRTVYPEPVGRCAVLVAVTAVFWRSRFKYGVRGYRFALIEAGHVVQNVLLAATALRLGAVPLSGFYDRPMDELLELDGVNESMVYAVAVGAADVADGG